MESDSSDILWSIFGPFRKYIHGKLGLSSTTSKADRTGHHIFNIPTNAPKQLRCLKLWTRAKISLLASPGKEFWLVGLVPEYLYLAVFSEGFSFFPFLNSMFSLKNTQELQASAHRAQRLCSKLMTLRSVMGFMWSVLAIYFYEPHAVSFMQSILLLSCLLQAHVWIPWHHQTLGGREAPHWPKYSGVIE